jgi:hypothetical protein
MNNNSIRTYYVKEYFENLKRHKNFYGTSQINEDGSWRIHVFADHFTSVDISSTYAPNEDMEKIFVTWVKQLSSN